MQQPEARKTYSGGQPEWNYAREFEGIANLIYTGTNLTVLIPQIGDATF